MIYLIIFATPAKESGHMCQQIVNKDYIIANDIKSLKELVGDNIIFHKFYKGPPEDDDCLCGVDIEFTLYKAGIIHVKDMDWEIIEKGD
jgi:hypothetical protein